MNEHRAALAIVGSGPAGLSAALTAASLGVDTVVLDAHLESGGHFYSLPPDEFRLREREKEVAAGAQLDDAVRRAGAHLWHGTEVWGIYPEKPWLMCLSGGSSSRLRADAVIVATGAEERALPFPGWTLPGVITAGAAQRLLKNQRLLPGRRFLLSGSGPLQFALATGLVRAGAQVAAVLEARSISSLMRAWRHFPSLLSQGARGREGAGYLGSLLAARVPVRAGWSVARACGQDGVESAVICRLDKEGHPLRQTEQELAVDTICLGYSLAPATRLWRLVDVATSFDPLQQCQLPVRDAWGQTTQSGLYVAGDAAGINGHQAARLEGQLAGLAVAAQLGVLSDARLREESRLLLEQLDRERSFGRLLSDLFGPLPGMLDLATDDTVICRCENVTLGQARQAVADGAVSVQGVKHHSRAGMGWCQGRTCSDSIAGIVAAETGMDLALAGRQTLRPPAFPVPLAELLEEDIHG